MFWVFEWSDKRSTLMRSLWVLESSDGHFSLFLNLKDQMIHRFIKQTYQYYPVWVSLCFTCYYKIGQIFLLSKVAKCTPHLQILASNTQNSLSAASLNSRMVLLYTPLHSRPRTLSGCSVPCWYVCFKTPLLAVCRRAADCAGCHSAEGKHQAHCHDYHLNPWAGEAEVTSKSCVTALSMNKLLGTQL